MIRILFAALVWTCLFAGTDLHAKDGKFRFEGWRDIPLTVWYTAPDMSAPEMPRNVPVVFVMHGVRRNGEDYRDQWSALAREHGFLLLVPEFPQSRFPRAAYYNLGNVRDADGQPVPEEEWTFAALDPIFDHAVERFDLDAKGYALYGHSAGAQFVHRFMLFQTDARVTRAVAANAGWYTLPSACASFPYGIEGTQVDRDRLAAYLQKPMTVLLGEADNDPDHRYLRRTPEANAQGPHRFARGQYFYSLAGRMAESLEVPHNWVLGTVPGVGHSNTKMARHAVPWLLDDAPALRPRPPVDTANCAPIVP